MVDEPDARPLTAPLKYGGRQLDRYVETQSGDSIRRRRFGDMVGMQETDASLRQRFLDWVERKPDGEGGREA